MEKINKLKFKNRKGITLIVLIITVVVMLILAGVAISAVVDGDGLFSKTRQATEIYENSAEEENSLISELIEKIENMNSNIELTYTTESQAFSDEVNINFKVQKLPEDINLNMDYSEYASMEVEYLDKLERSEQEAVFINYLEMNRTSFSDYAEKIEDINDAYKYLYYMNSTTKLCTSLEEVLSEIPKNANINTIGEMIFSLGSEFDLGYDYENGKVTPILTVNGMPVILDENLEAEYIAAKNTQYECELRMLGYVDTVVINTFFEKVTYNDALKQLKPGDYILYDTGVPETGEIVCRVLYDADSEYGLQIISDCIKENGEYVEIQLGDWGARDENIETYNNSIKILNDKIEKYKNNLYVLDSRCVGSNPKNKYAGNNEIYDDHVIDVGYEIKLKEQDENYITDFTQLEIYDMLNSLNDNTTFYLASRIIEEGEVYYSTGIHFGIRVHGRN